jgi:hypothetical protein
MKIVNRIVLGSALAVLIAAYFGCEKPEPPIVEPPVGPGRVEVYFFDDTLRIHPAPPYPDAPGFAIVIDDNGRVMRGEVVDLSVAPSHMGISNLRTLRSGTRRMTKAGSSSTSFPAVCPASRMSLPAAVMPPVLTRSLWSFLDRPSGASGSV